MSKRPKRERRDLKKIKTLQKNSVLLFRENPFFFHLFHRLKDDDEKKKRRERERQRERERERDTRLGREGRLRARDDDDDEGREREWTKIIIHYYYILGF